MRDTDMVARVGGEEFALLLPETGAASAFSAAERVRAAVEDRPFDVAGTVTISAGVCSLADAGDAESMLRLADRALYRAKKDGRNMTFRHAAASQLGRLPRRAALRAIA
jgi:diguanylate cyclase (GGDEF)-like protein